LTSTVLNQNGTFAENVKSKRVQAKEIKYNHNSMKIEELVSKIGFNVLVPDKLPNDCTLEIKTYPEGANDGFTQIRLHYMDKDDKVMFVGIGQRKSSKTQLDFSFQDVETVNINGHKGYFKAFDNAPGGILRWNQEGTFVEMDSNNVTKQEMIEIANSMKVAK
jgi:Domain of unknown function (DUF4367)